MECGLVLKDSRMGLLQVELHPLRKDRLKCKQNVISPGNKVSTEVIKIKLGD